jgi:hypothetical protein
MDNDKNIGFKYFEKKMIQFENWLYTGYRIPIIIIVCGVIIMLSPIFILLYIISVHLIEEMWHRYCYHTPPIYQIVIGGLFVVFIGVISIPVTYFSKRRQKKNEA